MALWLVQIMDDEGRVLCATLVRNMPGSVLRHRLECKYPRVVMMPLDVCESEDDLEHLCRECCEPISGPEDSCTSLG